MALALVQLLQGNIISRESVNKIELSKTRILLTSEVLAPVSCL